MYQWTRHFKPVLFRGQLQEKLIIEIFFNFFIVLYLLYITYLLQPTTNQHRKQLFGSIPWIRMPFFLFSAYSILFLLRGVIQHLDIQGRIFRFFQNVDIISFSVLLLFIYFFEYVTFLICIFFTSSMKTSLLKLHLKLKYLLVHMLISFIPSVGFLRENFVLSLLHVSSQQKKRHSVNIC